MAIQQLCGKRGGDVKCSHLSTRGGFKIMSNLAQVVVEWPLREFFEVSGFFEVGLFEIGKLFEVRKCINNVDRAKVKKKKDCI